MNQILCIDSYTNQRLLYEQELSLEGYKTTTVSNGREALEKVKMRRPDLIIMDVCMLNMNDIKALCDYVKKHKDTPLIIYTAYAGYKCLFRSWAIDAYIVKSSDLTELKNKIKELLKKEAVVA